MKIDQAYREARLQFMQAGIEDASLEAEALLRFVTGQDRAAFFRDMERQMDALEYESFLSAAGVRLSGLPLAYVTGQKEFYGRRFIVSPDVLIPRPETEQLVSLALDYCRDHGYRTVADVGTGSGVIAVSLAVLLPDVLIYATDISEQALEVAGRNAVLHHVDRRIEFKSGFLLDPVPCQVDLICANLPYVPGPEIVASELLRREPVIALDGGPEGLDVLRIMCSKAVNHLNPGGSVILEIGQGQARSVIEEFKRHVPEADIDVYPDLAGIERFVTLRLTA